MGESEEEIGEIADSMVFVWNGMYNLLDHLVGS